MLSREWMDRCIAHGHDAVRAYAEGRNQRSHALSSHGADTNPELWAMSKMGEVAFAIWAGIDPDRGLNWNNRADDGKDLVAFRHRWDVKTIEDHKRFLIWPINKRHLFHEKQFDALVHVKAAAPLFTIAKWINKQAFFNEKLIANGFTPPGLTEGTWYMYEGRLWEMETVATLMGAVA